MMNSQFQILLKFFGCPTSMATEAKINYLKRAYSIIILGKLYKCLK